MKKITFFCLRLFILLLLPFFSGAQSFLSAGLVNRHVTKWTGNIEAYASKGPSSGYVSTAQGSGTANLGKSIRETAMEEDASLAQKLEGIRHHATEGAFFAINNLAVTQNTMSNKAIVAGQFNSTAALRLLASVKNTAEYRKFRLSGGQVISGSLSTASLSAAEAMELQHEISTPSFGLEAYTAAMALASFRICHSKNWPRCAVSRVKARSFTSSALYSAFPTIKKFVKTKTTLVYKNMKFSPTLMKKNKPGLTFSYRP